MFFGRSKTPGKNHAILVVVDANGDEYEALGNPAGQILSSVGGGVIVDLPNAAGGIGFTAAEVGQWVYAPAAECTFFAKLSNTATPAAVIEIYGSHYNTGTGILLGTLSLNGAQDEASGDKDRAFYPWKCAKCVSISGVSAVATPTMSH